MNVVFISPHFPEYYHNFCSRLKDRGVNVLGVGDCPYDMISDETKNSLTEYYYVGSLENYIVRVLISLVNMVRLTGLSLKMNIG